VADAGTPLKGATSGSSSESTPGGILGVFTVISKYLIPVLVSIVSIAALVAVIGGVTMWSRFYFTQVPPEQAVDAMQDPELIVVGAVALALIGTAAVMIVLAAYVIDSGGRQTKKVARSLVAFAVIGGLAVCLIAEQDGLRAVAAAVVMVVVGLGVSLGLFNWGKVINKNAGNVKPIEGERPPGIRYQWMNDNRDDPPERFLLTGAGRAILVAVAILCAVAVGVLLKQPWLAGAVVVATVLAWATYVVAYSTGAAFVWYGVALFFSVLLFGTYVSMADLAIHKRVQPVAVIRPHDQPGQGLLGFYVTENGGRLYAAQVAMGCGQTGIRKDSGRLFFVPKNDLRAVSIGPFQDVEDAIDAPAEMLRQLWAARVPAPAGTTGAQGNVSEGQAARPQSKPASELDDEADTGDAPNRAAADVEPPQPPVNFSPKVTSIRLKNAREDEQPGEQLAASSGEIVVVEGTDFGAEPRVTVDDVRARITSYPEPEGDSELEFRVPHRAESGRVEVRCGQRDPAELRVRHRPVPIVRAWKLRRNRMRLSARRSKDADGRIVRYEWTLAGGRSDRGPLLTERRPRRGQPSVIRLTIVDSGGLQASMRLEVHSRRGGLRVDREVTSSAE